MITLNNLVEKYVVRIIYKNLYLKRSLFINIYILKEHHSVVTATDMRNFIQMNSRSNSIKKDVKKKRNIYWSSLPTNDVRLFLFFFSAPQTWPPSDLFILCLIDYQYNYSISSFRAKEEVNSSRNCVHSSRPSSLARFSKNKRLQIACKIAVPANRRARLCRLQVRTCLQTGVPDFVVCKYARALY